MWGQGLGLRGLLDSRLKSCTGRCNEHLAPAASVGSGFGYWKKTWGHSHNAVRAQVPNTRFLPKIVSYTNHYTTVLSFCGALMES